LTEEQAQARSEPGAENKGREAALAAIEMATLLRQVEQEIAE
jgi:6,7-dimethyl-8-ribityllumazine synthase